MWSVEYKEYPSSSPGLDPIRRVLISNGCGVVLEHIGANRERADHICYYSNIVSFKFWASRWDADGQILLDRFEGYISHIPSVSNLGEYDRKKVYSDIEAALMHWPPNPLNKTLAIQRVILR